jgi:hypothetical protein
MRKLAFAAALAVAAPLTVTTASATGFYVIDSSSSSISDIRRIGGSNIPEILSYSNTNPFLLDPMNPKTWPVLGNTLGLWDPANPGVLPVVANQAAVGGTINVIGGNITEASISQLGQLSFGTFQSFDFDTGIGTISDMRVNGLVWSWNPVTGQLNHQQAPGNGGYAECVPAGGNPSFGGSTGTATSGQCRQLAAAVNSSGVFGQGTIANSWLNWDGVPDGYSVQDASSRSTPWHTGTDTSLTVGPQSAVEWDLTGFVEGVGGIIRARVTAAALSSGLSGSAFSALYTMNVTFIPVPAAVWLFISGLGLLGFMRRRSGASA